MRAGFMWAATSFLSLFVTTSVSGETGVDGSCAGDGCPPIFIIGDLETDFVDQGTTCGFQDSIRQYGVPCRIAGTRYPGPDAVYGIELTQGNQEIEFKLDLSGSTADLVVTLLGSCTDGSTCVASSPDFDDPDVRVEAIPKTRYAPGMYFLYVDSFFPPGTPGNCGEYVLTVSGTNPPEPDLALDIAASTNPVVAGTDLTYTFTVTNVSPFSATGVRVVTTLPAGVEPKPPLADQDCTGTLPGPITCPVEDVGRGEIGERMFTVRVGPSYHVDFPEEPLTLEARVVAAETDRNESNDVDTVRLGVDAKADMIVTKEAFACVPRSDPEICRCASPPGAQPLEEAVAGERICYNLTVTNGGPSTATDVVVDDLLPEDTTLISFPSVCTAQDNATRLQCKLSRLLPRAKTGGPVKLDIDPDRRTAITNTASVEAEEPEPEDDDGEDNEVTTETDVVAQADLRVTLEAVPDPVRAGSRLGYEVQVTNGGLSSATGISLTVELPEAVRVDRAPMSCLLVAESFRCSIQRLGPGETSAPLRFRVTVDPSYEPTTQGPLSAKASVKAIEADLELTSNNRVEKTQVETSAELILEKTPMPKSVAPGDLLIYSLMVKNQGPSDARDVTVTDMLPPDSEVQCKSVVGCPDVACPSPGNEVTCAFDLVRAGSSVEFVVVVEVLPSAGNELSNKATVSSTTSGSPNQSMPEPVTVIMPQGLTLTIEDTPDPVSPDEILSYTLTVRNHDATEADEVRVVSKLPGGLTLKENQTFCDPPCSCMTQSENQLDCMVGTLASGETAVLAVEGTVTAEAPGFLLYEARVNGGNPTFEETSVATDDLLGPVLAVPRFLTDVPLIPQDEVAPFRPATLYSVQSGSRQPLILQFDYMDDEGTPALRLPEVRPLFPRALRSVDLRQSLPPGFRTTERSGSVRISIFDPRTGNEVPGRPVVGDFVHIESGPQARFLSASGSLLYDLQHPPARDCQTWNVGILGEGPLRVDTDLLFLLPDNQGTEVAATNFDQDEEVTERSVTTSLDSFEVSARSDLQVAGSGTVDLSFEVPGVVFSTHRGAGPAVGAPGVCLDPSDTGRELLVPFYELSQGRSARINVRNTSDSPIMVEVECCDADGMPCMDIDVGEVLGHAVRDIELTDCPEVGFVQISTSEDVLAGEYILLPDADTAHGDSLVNKDLDRVPADLCRRWDQRFVQETAVNGDAIVSTDVLVYMEDALGEFESTDGGSSDPLLVGMVFDGDGRIVRNEDESAKRIEIDGQEVAFRRRVGDFGLPTGLTSGTIEWRFRNDKIGHIAYILESGEMSVLIPAVCRDLGPPD